VAWQVTWAEIAQDDLDKIASYIAKDSENYAAAFVREMLDAARSLEHLAQRGRIVPEWHDVSIRELIVRNYRLIYQLTESVASIIGVVHGARDLEALWKREGRR
jgi:addiction module RelE/StbE family toxin